LHTKTDRQTDVETLLHSTDRGNYYYYFQLLLTKSNVEVTPDVISCKLLEVGQTGIFTGKIPFQ